MRVCVLTTSFPLYEGIAVGIHVIEQARHLVRLGVEVDVVAPHHSGAARREEIDGVHVYRFRYMWPDRLQTLCYGAGIPTNLRRSWWAKVQLLCLELAFLWNGLRCARHCDVIQANWSIAGLAGIALGKILDKPVVLMMYGAEVFVLGDNPLIKYIIRNADYLIGISRYTLEQTVAVHRPKAYSLIPPGVDVQRFRPCVDTAEIERELSLQGIDLSKPLIFALGKFIERKGFSYLIDAVALLQEKAPAQLMIGGRGPLKDRLRKQAEDLGIADRVVFLEYIPDDSISAYYAIADLFVSPSIVDSHGDTEGLGMVLLEALACATPCVASAVGGILDIIEEGKNGFLVEPGNSAAIAERAWQLISDDRLRREMGKQGRLSVEERFSWQVKAREILQVYAYVLGEESGSDIPSEDH